MKLTEFPKTGCVYIDSEKVDEQKIVNYLNVNSKTYVEKWPTNENYLVWDESHFWYTTNKSTNKILYIYQEILDCINGVDKDKYIEILTENPYFTNTRKGEWCKIVSKYDNGVYFLNSYGNKVGLSLSCQGTDFKFTTEIPLPNKENKPSLVGRYLKALVNNPQSISKATAGDLFLIVKQDTDFLIEKIDNSDEAWFVEENKIGKVWELMPEGFKMKYKFKVGDKVKIKTSGSGYNWDCVGEVVEILKLGVYNKNPGYRTTIPSKGESNAKSGAYNCMAGEESFELYTEEEKKKPSYKTDWQVGDAFEVTVNNPLGSKLVTSKVYYIYSIDDDEVTTALTKNGPREPACAVRFKYMKPVKEDVYPEYVEALESSEPFTTEGKIYKTTSRHNVPNNTSYSYINNQGNDDGYWKAKMKPSTKEAYDKQFITEEEWFPEVGDWVVIIAPHNKINWAPEMDRYVGKVFQLDKLTYREYGYYSIEGNTWTWEYSENTKHFRKAAEYEIPVTTTKVEKLYEALPIPNTTEYFYARVTKDIIKGELEESWRLLPEIIPKGSITWFHKIHLFVFNNNIGTVHPESNRWHANLPVEYFEVIDTSLLAKSEVESVDEVKSTKNSNKLVRLTIFTPSTPVLEKENSISLLNIKSIKKLF